MKSVWGVIGILLVLTGIVWTLQGANVLLGSFMSGSPLWLVIGLIFVAGGSVLAYLNFRGRRGDQPESE